MLYHFSVVTNVAAGMQETEASHRIYVGYSMCRNMHSASSSLTEKL
jgi:hypothetical protein